MQSKVRDNPDKRIRHGLFIGHRHTHSREYRTWCHMHQRCNNPKNKDFMTYGARGISVCKRWSQFSIFQKDMGPCPIGHSLDRINNMRGYYPKNCRWADSQTQANNRRSSVKIKIGSTEKTLSQWANFFGIEPRTLWARINRMKMPLELALTVGKIKTAKKWNMRADLFIKSDNRTKLDFIKAMK